MTLVFFSHNLFIKSVLAVGTLFPLILFFKVVYGIVFGVTPGIKIILFGVKRLKNRRATSNGEAMKDEKKKKELSGRFPKPNMIFSLCRTDKVEEQWKKREAI